MNENTNQETRMIEMMYCGGKYYAGTEEFACGQRDEPCRKCLKRHIARLEARVGELEAARVVPELPTWEDGENKLRRGEKLTALEKFVMDHDWSKTDTKFRDGLEAVFAELRSAIPASRVLRDGEERIGAEELAVLREIVRLVDEARERYDKRPRGAGGQRMPDEIDELLCRLYEIGAHPALRTQPTEGGV